jgi:predicted glycoside hydrolase/deacetylase ChbG (UPF0249 family)
MTRFVLCADDFAMTDGVSRAILELLASRRITATGAMTNRPGWRGWANSLMVYADRADLGVHLNLTCASPLGRLPTLCPGGDFPPLARVIRAALTSAAVRRELSAEIGRQLDAFEQATGREPDFVDGHQHVHAMPGVRALALAEIARRYRAGTVYVRDPSDSLKAIRDRGVAVRKAFAISALASGFGAKARALGFPTNEGFAGVSSFDASRDFIRDMRSFASAPGRRHLVMCHPGYVDAELQRLDPVLATRPIEFEALRRGIGLEGHKIVRFSAFRGA